MTKNRARKKLVRQRAAKTGESYTSALRQLLVSKENTVTTADPQTTCALCAIVDDGTIPFVIAGLPFCQPCHERIRSAVRSHLEPEASRVRRPLDWFASSIVIEPERDGWWAVHLHTLQPGLVIGRKGVTADLIRRSLVEVRGDERVRLNVLPHEPFGSPRPIDEGT